MAFVMIIMTLTSRPAFATAEFTDKAACEYAREQVIKAHEGSWGITPHVICVPKSSEAP